MGRRKKLQVESEEEFCSETETEEEALGDDGSTTSGERSEPEEAPAPVGPPSTAMPSNAAATPRARKRRGKNPAATSAKPQLYKPRSIFASRYYGVRQLSSGEWIAQLWEKGRGITTLGAFNTENEAARCYDQRALAIFGNGCSLNFEDSHKHPSPEPLTSLANGPDGGGSGLLLPSRQRKQSPPLPPSDEFVGHDGNLGSCSVCDEGGNLVCCDTCANVYHQKCMPPGPWRSILPFQAKNEEWFCVSCMCGDTDDPTVLAGGAARLISEEQEQRGSSRNQAAAALDFKAIFSPREEGGSGSSSSSSSLTGERKRKLVDITEAISGGPGPVASRSSSGLLPALALRVSSTEADGGSASAESSYRELADELLSADDGLATIAPLLAPFGVLPQQWGEQQPAAVAAAAAAAAEAVGMDAAAAASWQQGLGPNHLAEPQPFNHVGYSDSLQASAAYYPIGGGQQVPIMLPAINQGADGRGSGGAPAAHIKQEHQLAHQITPPLPAPHLHAVAEPEPEQQQQQQQQQQQLQLEWPQQLQPEWQSQPELSLPRLF